MKDNRSLEQKIREVHQAVLEAAFDRNTKIRMKMANVGRPTGENKLAKQGEIKTKVIDEDTAVASVSTKDTPKEQPESGNKKKENNKDLLEPGKIQGGKTEVDLEPSTDDRDDDGKKIDDKSKKATKAANAKAGVKEETMNTKNFGLPADLIKTVAEAMGKCTKCAKKPCTCEAVEEELKGGQKKIDKNHNGKIDGQDFKILRGKKKVEEEVEELDELAPATMKSYQGKAADSIGHASQSARSMGSDKDHLKKPLGNEIRKRKKGLNLAGERLAKKDMDEETDPGFSEAELAHINAILESDDFNYANSKDHKPLSNWPKVHAAIHNDYTDSGGGGTEGEKTELGKTPIHPKYHAAHDEAEANPKKMKKVINVHYGHDVSRDD